MLRFRVRLIEFPGTVQPYYVTFGDALIAAFANRGNAELLAIELNNLVTTYQDSEALAAPE